ncbi:hypothetical protein BFP72_04410 [Reichenbachiella sp. 5M10]|uniref:hypothetical protein n=1 Tax=Reichenbachiella sp. 5M10 TaxID=1889772 RepID=UPI000C15A2F3|nr:hypothetical protein [Reichenbachiella sp. 5M10]PIB34703.1 hypothetical protein BFP72_04410 [Reichenbachiella sp. 5M10]
MLESGLSLLSIGCGILGAHLTTVLLPRLSFGLTGNTIAGVFGSVFLVKSLGRLGFSPSYIIVDQQVDSPLLLLNLLISLISGFGAVIFSRFIQRQFLP